MTCKWCKDEKTMRWDEAERGCPPPPKGHDPEGEWDRMEASLLYDNGKILLGEDMLVVKIPCPVCVGFGRARDQPFNGPETTEIEKWQPPMLARVDTPEYRWERQYLAMLAFRSGMAGIAVMHVERQYQLAKQQWLKFALQREQFRTDLEPAWPIADWDYKGGLCPICQSGNFAPTRHPRTQERAIGCCDCGGVWLFPDQPEPTPAETERRKTEAGSMRYTLEHSFLLSPGEAEMLLNRYGYDLIDRVYRYKPHT
jgi:hypothetical protein